MSYSEELDKVVKKNTQKIEKAKENLLLHIKKQVGDAHESLTDLINEKLEGVNEQVKKIDDKYKSMFGALVSEFLVKLEKRTYENEIYMAALYRLNVEELYKLKGSDVEMTQDEYARISSDRLGTLIEEEVARFNSERAEGQPEGQPEGQVDGPTEGTVDGKDKEND